jgi:hypothetical protein
MPSKKRKADLTKLNTGGRVSVKSLSAAVLHSGQTDNRKREQLLGVVNSHGFNVMLWIV